MQLGYTLGENALSNVQLSSLRIYGSVRNAFTLTEYRGFDPSASSGDPLASGIDNGFYPVARTFLVGVNAKFLKNRKMERYKIYILLFLAAIGFNACSEEYLEIESEDPNSENFFNSQADYENALVAAYDLLQSTYLNVMLGDIASDNTLAGGESATDVIGIQQIDDMIHTPVNDQLSDIWRWMFAGVNRANYILEFQDKTDFPDKPRVLGEARFLRAYYYFELVKFFGDVPLVVDQRFLFGDQFDV